MERAGTDLLRIDHRQRLIDGMATAVAEKGYAVTTIADVVAAAHVSRRTFYEHFADKEACLLAAYESAAGEVLAVITTAAGDEERWQQRIEATVRAYLAAMISEPERTRTFLVEIHSAGPRARRRRTEVLERVAAQIRELIGALELRAPEISTPSPALALAMIAALNELVLLAIADGADAPPPEIERAAIDLVLATLTTPSR